VRDKFTLKSLIENSDIVVHAAAYISVEESFEKPAEYFNNNVGGTASVAKTCLEHSKLLVYFSSASVYGNPIKIPIPEDHPLKPLSPYGLSKLMSEQVVEFYGGLGLKYVIIRPFNVYGPGQSEAYAGVITRFINSACRSKPLVVFGDGFQTRDFIFIDDISRLVELVIEKTPTSEVFNAGSGVPTRILDLAKTVIRLMGVQVEIKHDKPRLGDIRDSWADMSKARRLLGFYPAFTLENGLRITIRELCPGFTRF